MRLWSCHVNSFEMNRGALNLLTGYGDDSSDDEMPSVRVSIKRTHRQSEDNDFSKPKRYGL